MELQNNNTKVKRPFRLVKFFTFTCLIVMFAGTIVIAAVNAHWVKNLLQQKNEDYAHLLIENLNHQVFLQFIIPVVLKYGKIRLREENQYKRMDRVVKNTIHSFNVEMVNIYDMKNIISYSLDKKKIGLKNTGGTGFKKAMEGKSTSALVQQGNAVELFFGFPEETRLVTFAPIRAERPLSSISGPVLGVVEIVQNLSKNYKDIFKLQILVISTCSFVMGILLLVLIFVVRQGELILKKRAEERLRLEEKLRRAEHLSAIGEMTAGISHEVRNPLGIIKSSAELLQKKMKKLDASSAIPAIIVEESMRLDNIIKDFLNFAKPRNPNFQTCRVEQIIEKNISFLDTEIRENNFEIEKRFSDDLPEIMADSAMLYQAFLNIILNSFQAMLRGGRIIISIFSDDKSIILIFEDNGKGIKDKDLKKIWNPFFTTKEMGTGLGLGIVKNIIESHMGEIKVSNRSSGGVQVEIILPVKEI